MIPIAPHITAFLRDRLPGQRGASAHACDSYAYSLQLLFEFASQRFGMAPSALSLEQIDAPLVMDLLLQKYGNPQQGEVLMLAYVRARSGGGLTHGLADQRAIDWHRRGTAMHEVLCASTAGDGRTNPLGDDGCRPRRGLKTPQCPQVLEERGIPTRRREILMMLDEGSRLQW
jgi:hypothetical protein